MMQSLPETKFILDILNGAPIIEECNNEDNNDNNGSDGIVIIDGTKLKEAQSNLQRARDILQSSMPELNLATYLLEVDLQCVSGRFDAALDALARYRHLSNQLPVSEGNANSHGRDKTKLQFLKAKLLVNGGKFDHALSEYEDLLEGMEEEAERQMRRMEQRQQQLLQGVQEGEIVGEQETTEEEEEEPLPVIHGAAALTGVGVAKLLILMQQNVSNPLGDDEATRNDIVESLTIATDMLLESRKEALMSPLHAQLAIDLGLAAVISLTNLGVAQYCLTPSNNGSDHSSSSIDFWKRGLETLDEVLMDAMTSATIIPKYKFQCMESVKARLYGNISWTLLGLGNNNNESNKNDDVNNKVSEEILKEASDAAKKALDIGDELMHGSKLLREDDGTSGEDEEDIKDDSINGAKDENVGKEDLTDQQEWDTFVKEKAGEEEQQQQHDEQRLEEEIVNNAAPPKEIALSPLWTAHHKAESARALSLLASCYAKAGAAVTAEGLFQSAMDASSSCTPGQNVTSRGDDSGGSSIVAEKGVSLSSPSLGWIARDVRLQYAALCANWEKRKGDSDRLVAEARKIEEEGVLKGFVGKSKGGGQSEQGGDKDTPFSVSGLESSLWLFGPIDFER